MKPTLFVLPCALATSLLAATPEPGHPDSSGWKPLFARDFSDAIAPPGVWTWDGDVLTASEDQALWTKNSYGDCVIDLEFKNGPAANSGVVVYCTDLKNWIPNSVEVQILDDYASEWVKAAPTWKCGGVFGHLAPKPNVVKKAGEWNRMTITCKGPNIDVVLNGQAVASMDMRKWTSAKKNPDGSEIPEWLNRPFAELAQHGQIGVQGKHGGAPIYFRNLRIKDLTPSK